MRLLIVDDSRIFRTILQNILSTIPEIEIVGSVFSAAKALAFLAENDVDLVTMDLNMPEMDGVEATKAISEMDWSQRVRPQVVMLYSRQGDRAERAVEALGYGAIGVLDKPSDSDREKNSAALIKALKPYLKWAPGAVPQQRAPIKRPAAQPLPSKPLVAASAATTRSAPAPESKPAPLIKGGPISLIAIGSSTGGPEALRKLMPELCSLTKVPVVIVQHMPADFTKPFAEGLNRICSRTVYEAEDNRALAEGDVVVAAGGKHLVVRGEPGSYTIHFDDGPAEQGVKPAVDVCYRSLLQLKRTRVCSLILTGMGRDGALHLGDLRAQGAHVMVQSEASSLVYGMPRAAAESGHFDEQMSLEDIPKAMVQLLHKRGFVLS